MKRGCGTRKKGGAYFETKLTKYGSPIEAFIIEPPVQIEPEYYGLSPIAQALMERDGVYHVLDWIGSSFYPNVADFIEEGKRFGFSRRISVDPTPLTRESRLLTVHARAVIINHEDFTPALDFDFTGHQPWGYCPKGNHEKTSDGECVGMWWHDVRPLQDGAVGGWREQPEFTYYALDRGKDFFITRPGIFMSLPISNIAIVDDPENGIDDVYDRVKNSGLKVEIVPE